MRKLVIAAVAAAATLMGAGSASGPAQAITIASPAGLAGAIEDMSGIEEVHCRPGWAHHYPTRWRRADGCGRHHWRVYRHHWRRHHWRRHHWHHRRHWR
jgi:hypothetical protein